MKPLPTEFLEAGVDPLAFRALETAIRKRWGLSRRSVLEWTVIQRFNNGNGGQTVDVTYQGKKIRQGAGTFRHCSLPNMVVVMTEEVNQWCFRRKGRKARRYDNRHLPWYMKPNGGTAPSIQAPRTQVGSNENRISLEDVGI